MDSVTSQIPKRLSHLSLTLLFLLVLATILGVFGAGLFGINVLNSLADGEQESARRRDNAQIAITRLASLAKDYNLEPKLTLRAGASSGAALPQSASAELAANLAEARLWLALDALGRGNAPLAQAQLQEAERARPSTSAAQPELVLREFARLQGWAAIPAARAQELDRWNETLGREVLRD
jgi:hypothetical protein